MRTKCLAISIVIVLSLFLSCISPILAEDQAVPKTSVVATFNGTSITEDDLRKAAAKDLDNLEIQAQQIKASMARAEYQILESTLIRLLADRIFEAEAATQGITKQALLEKDLTGKVAEPSPQQINAFYEANKQQLNKPLDQVADQIKRIWKRKITIEQSASLQTV